MCELLGMSARWPTTVRLSMEELARHGGGTGPHRDGWGIAFVHERDALIVREPVAAHDSRWLACLCERQTRATTVIAHVRRATQGALHLRNTQPFGRELGGHMHVFAHNGMLPGVEARFAVARFRRIGDTDSEHAFCALLERLAPLWDGDTVPPLAARLETFARFAAEVRELGPANLVYSDGDALFVHAHRRRHDDGEIHPPGLHLLCRTCSATADGAALAGVELGDDVQDVALVASVPLSREPWEALPEGTVLALRDGRVVLRG